MLIEVKLKKIQNEKSNEWEWEGAEDGDDGIVDDVVVWIGENNVQQKSW